MICVKNATIRAKGIDVKTKQNKQLQSQLKRAVKKVIKLKNAISTAEKNLDQAENNLYQLQYQRDHDYIESLGKKVDWPLIFNYRGNETELVRAYREKVLSQHGLNNLSGHYNDYTRQHCFYIEFESNTPEEFFKRKEQVEFLFSHLKFDFKEQKQRVFVRNLINDDHYNAELTFSKVTNKYALELPSWRIKNKLFEYDALDLALEAIQAISKVSGDAKA